MKKYPRHFRVSDIVIPISGQNIAKGIGNVYPLGKGHFENDPSSSRGKKSVLTLPSLEGVQKDI